MQQSNNNEYNKNFLYEILASGDIQKQILFADLLYRSCFLKLYPVDKQPTDMSSFIYEDDFSKETELNFNDKDFRILNYQKVFGKYKVEEIKLIENNLSKEKTKDHLTASKIFEGKIHIGGGITKKVVFYEPLYKGDRILKDIFESGTFGFWKLVNSKRK